MSRTTYGSPRASASIWRSAIHSRTSGCTMALSRWRAPDSPKATAARRARSRSPAGVRIEGPNSPTSRRSPSVPLAWTARVASSASITATPRSWRSRLTVLFPVPMPPVSPMTLIWLGCCSDGGGEARRDRRRGRAVRYGGRHHDGEGRPAGRADRKGDQGRRQERHGRHPLHPLLGAGGGGGLEERRARAADHRRAAVDADGGGGH